MNKKKATTGDIDTPQMAQMRQAVVEQELSARSWKAYYDKMYYSLEAEKLEPLYKEYQERVSKKLADEKAKMEAFMKKLEESEVQKEVNPEEIKLEEVK